MPKEVAVKVEHAVVLEAVQEAQADEALPATAGIAPRTTHTMHLPSAHC